VLASVRILLCRPFFILRHRVIDKIKIFMQYKLMRIFKRQWVKIVMVFILALYLVPLWPQLNSECIASNITPSIFNPLSSFACSIAGYIFLFGIGIAAFFVSSRFSPDFFKLEWIIIRLTLVFICLFIGIYLFLFFLIPYLYLLVRSNNKKRSPKLQ